ncbi:hypothetical protein J437_LFUL019102 [Ladona fulva]|uniref:DDE-1 domain-containing protein n=1 Tax=Ladona fulva TaxID=123851 RepID=A0A8K0P804_LADFU|nr:hypothetical protein J437_LFUL019102 [Ladona fulva]
MAHHFLCVNMIGEFEPPVIIGNAANPHCFKGVEWKSNKNSWMTSGIMSEWLEKFNRKLKRQDRKILLFLDNATCHPDLQFSNIKLIFLPPNTSKKVTVWDAILWTISSIESIQPSTVTKCFLKAGFPGDQDPKTFVIENDDELFIEIQELVAKLPCDMSTEGYLCVDHGVSTTNVDIDCILESTMSTKHGVM